MALFVNTNVSALSGQRNLMEVTSRMNSSFEKLSSGSRINSARDDAAGLQISDRLSTQITGLNQATRNANDGISIAQIAEGALGEITNNVQRMRQLVVQGGNRTLSDDDRSALGEEFTKLLNVNNQIAERTSYGTLNILNSSSPESGFQIQSGSKSGEQDTVTTGNAELTALFGKVAVDTATATTNLSTMDITNLKSFGMVGELTAGYMALNGTSDVTAAATALFGDITGSIKIADIGTDKGGSFEVDVEKLATLLTGDPTDATKNGNSDASHIANAVANVFTIGSAAEIDSNTGFSDAQFDKITGHLTDTLLDLMSGVVTQVDKQRAKLGAEQNGLTSTIRNNTTAVVNVSDSRARIRDTDFAAETAELTRNQIIQQASTTILSQANQLPQTALSLLR